MVRRFAPLVLDIALSPVTYYCARLLGYGDRASLVVGTVAVALRAGYLALVRRQFDGLVALMLLMNVTSLVLSTLVGDARLMLARDPMMAGLVGVVFLATCPMRQPAWFHVAKRLHPNAADRGRRPFVVITAAWAAGLMAEAGLRLVLIYQLPIGVMAGLGQVIELVVVVPLIGWTVWYGRRSVRYPALSRRTEVV